MNVLIITDLEGISGIDSIEQAPMDKKPEIYYPSCERLMADTNAAVEGAFLGGAKEVFVWDGHSGGKNFIEGKLDARAKQTPFHEIDFNHIHAVMQVGAHAMAGTRGAFLDHTWSSVRYYNYFVNGIACGEMVMIGLLAGAYGIPVVMMSGDSAACREAADFFPGIKAAEVKTALCRNRAVSVDLSLAAERIQNAAYEGLTSPVKPLPLNWGPLQIKLELNRTDYADEIMGFNLPGVVRSGTREVAKSVAKIEKYHDVLFSGEIKF